MKAKSTASSPRVLLSLGLCMTGLVLGSLALLLPTPRAYADPVTCSDPLFAEEAGNEYGEDYVTMSSDDGCTIYYTVNAYNWPADPTHSSAIYTARLGVPFGQRRYYKALAYKANALPTEDSAIVSYVADNSGL